MAGPLAIPKGHKGHLERVPSGQNRDNLSNKINNDGTGFLTQRTKINIHEFQLINVEGTRETEKSLLDKHHSSNIYR